MWYSIWVFFTVFFMNQRFCFALNKDLSFNLVSLLKRDQSPIFFTKLIRKPPRWPGVRWPSRGWPSNPIPFFSFLDFFTLQLKNMAKQNKNKKKGLIFSVNKQVPCFVLFQLQDKHGRLKSQ